MTHCATVRDVPLSILYQGREGASVPVCLDHGLFILGSAGGGKRQRQKRGARKTLPPDVPNVRLSAAAVTTKGTVVHKCARRRDASPTALGAFRQAMDQRRARVMIAGTRSNIQKATTMPMIEAHNAQASASHSALSHQPTNTNHMARRRNGRCGTLA